MKAVIYARYSCSGQREESIEGQIRECTEYAKRNNIQIVCTYADKAKTGKNDKEVEKAISNVLKAIEQGVITPSTKSRLEELENEKEEIEKQIIIESLEHPLLTREQVMYWFYNLRTINGKDLRSRKMLVDCFVNSVILHDDRIDFYFNYKEGAKTLSLKKLKKSSDMSTDFPPKALASASAFLMKFACGE